MSYYMLYDVISHIIYPFIVIYRLNYVYHGGNSDSVYHAKKFEIYI